MKYFDLSVLNRPVPHWTRFALAGVMVAALAGCGGGSDGAAGPAGPTGPAGATGPAGPTGPSASAAVSVASLTPAQWADAKFSATITGVTIAGAPVVSFQVADEAGHPVTGLAGFTAQNTTTAKFASYPNFAFVLAKLIPAANGSPSKWVNYAVTSVETKTAAVTASRPSSDNTGTLVETADGSYQYTFYRDITKSKEIVDGLTLTGANKAADLGDLTYDPNLTHRLVMQFYGNARGTGSNTADAVTVTPAVAMKNPINVIYDFIPATNKPVTDADAQREIVATAKCNECHSQIGVTTPHGGRIDTRYCVTCHNDQRKFGRAAAVATNGAFPALTRTVSATGSVSYSPSTYVVDGQAIGNFPVYIHKIHMGKELTNANYNYANVLFNEVTYPQPITNCVKCHDGSATSTAKTLQGDNWKNAPNAIACGACHDGINFKTGIGTALGAKGKIVGGHVGGAQADDALCATCHKAADIPVYHVTVDPTGANGRGGYPLNTAANVPTPGFLSGQGPSIPLASQLGTLPAGVYKIGMEIKQASVAGAAGAQKATIVYRITKDGAPVTFNATGNLITGVDGSPNLMVEWSIPRDGIASPADWYAFDLGGGTPIKSIRDGIGGNSQTGPDADGYYTATLARIVPDNATMVTAALGVGYNGFVQLNHPSFPQGIRLREPAFVMQTVTGYTARRQVVDKDKCNACHGQLGIAPSFHSGARNNGQGCALCHDPDRATGHVGATNSFGGGWSVSAKNLVHGIHSSSKRAQAFSYEATAANPGGFQEVTYPGMLKNCEQCHIPGSYDFSNAASAAALPNLVWTTEVSGDMSNPTNAASIGQSPWITTLGRGQVDYRTDNLVSSPIASACFGCHDSQTAAAHMQLNGGSLYASVSTVSTGGARPARGTDTGFKFTRVETCMVCHASGKVADIKAVHMN